MMFSATISMSIDSIIAGNLLGNEALATMSVATPLFVMITMISSILSNGGSTLASRALGENDTEKVNVLFTLVVFVDLLFSAVILALVLPNMQSIVYFMGARVEPINAMTISYVKGLMIGIVPMMLNSTLLYFIRITGNPRLGMTTTLVMALVDIAGDILFAGPLHMGTFGLALATSASYLAPCIMCVAYIMKSKCLKFARPKMIFKNTMSVFNLGFPSALNSFSAVVKGIVFNLVAVSLGANVLSVVTVQSAVGNMVGCVTLGVGFAIMPLAGIFFGEQDELSLTKTMKRAIRFGAIINIGLGVGIFLLASPLAGMFSINDPESRAMAIRAIRYFAFSMPFGMVGYAFTCYYQCTNRVWIANLLVFVKGVLFPVSFVLLGKSIFADNALWLNGLVSEGLSLVVIFCLAFIIQKKVEFSFKNIMLMPKEWEQAPPCYEVSLHNTMQEGVELSQDIQAFCDEHGESGKLSYYAALCMEEMALNTIAYGFQDNREHYIDIKVQAMEEEIRLRIRDDGIAFNPLDYVKKDEDDPTHNIGIRLVKGLAKQIDYRNTMRMNNLFIVLSEEKTISVETGRENWQTVCDFLQKVIEGYQCTPKASNQILLSMEELYGLIKENINADRTKKIVFLIRPCVQGAVLKVQWIGEEYNPLQDESTMGMRIIEKSLDNILYSYKGNSNNIIAYKYW